MVKRFDWSDKEALRRNADATAERARSIDDRWFRHRITGRIRHARWQPNGISFFLWRNEVEVIRPYHKALSWCANAVELKLSREAYS